MKKIYILLLATIMLLLVFFTFFGESLYEIGKPLVTTSKASYQYEEGPAVPLEAIYSDGEKTYVYHLIAEQGYSRIIYSVTRVEVEITVINEYQKTATLTPDSKINSGDNLITSATGIIKDGSRVILTRTMRTIT